MLHNPLNLFLLLKMSNSNASQTSIDLESLNKDALADELESGDFLYDAVIGSLVEAHRVLRLVLDLSLRPLLLFCSLTAT